MTSSRSFQEQVMRQTVVGVFDRYSSAQRAVQVLADSGFGADAVHITDELSDTVDDDAQRTARAADDDTITGKIRQFFAGLFGPDDDNDVTQFSETIRRGGAVVKVDVEDDDRVDMARQALERAGATDVDEESATGDLSDTRRTTWSDAPDAQRSTQTQSWTGASDTSDDMREQVRDAGTGEQAIPVVREELQVGKRAEQAGGVRVFTRAVDKPVEESVTLREERAQVERRPVDREVTAEDRSRAGDATVEVRETVEKPVVQKVARVVEEVVVGKDVQEREERIRETLHNTEVEVESLGTDKSRFDTSRQDVSGSERTRDDVSRSDMSSGDMPRSGMSSSDVSSSGMSSSDMSRSGMSSSDMSRPGMSSSDMSQSDMSQSDMSSRDISRSDAFGSDSAYRQHFATQYGASGSERYEDYEPAYRYGSSLASDTRYSGRRWDDIEEDVRRDWQTSNPGSAWDRFKAAVRHAWETATR
jgi:stress response protein YsnF